MKYYEEVELLMEEVQKKLQNIVNSTLYGLSEEWVEIVDYYVTNINKLVYFDWNNQKWSISLDI